MNRLGFWMPLLTTAAITWQEAAENPVVFCYRMGWGVYLGWRAQEAPTADMRTEEVCSNPSFTFCVSSTALKASKN